MDFSNLKVLVVGDCCLDIIEEGKSTRLSPEAPVPIISNPITTYSLGMSGNVALNLKSLGADVYISTCVGEVGKPNTLKLFELLDINEIKYKKRTVRTNSISETIVKKRILANDKQVARIDYENFNGTDELYLKTTEKIYDVYEANYFDLIIISDYNKGYISKESWSFIKPILEKYNKGNFFVDTKKLNVLDFYEGMYIFPNKKEMQDIMDFNNCNTRNELRKEMDLDFIVETASEEGAYLYKDDGKLYHSPVFKSNVVDVTGCGDTFVAAFSLYYTKYNDKKAALGFANYCCSKVIERKGTTPVLISEVLDFHDTKSI